MEQQKRIIVAIAATWPGLIESRQRVGDCFPLARAPRSERDGRTKRENKRERERGEPLLRFFECSRVSRKKCVRCFTIEEGRGERGESARIRSAERNWFGRVSRLKSRRVLGSVYTWAEN